MEALFLRILNMSFTASFIILIVLAARLLLKKMPKATSYSLWSLVLLRLVFPFSFESALSILPINSNPIPLDIAYSAIPKIDSGIAALDKAVNSSLPAATPTASVNPLQLWLFAGEILWLLGIFVLLLYSVLSLIALNKRLKGAAPAVDNIFFTNNLKTPIVLGLFSPKIYLPNGLSDDEKAYTLLHEQLHIKRFDHVIKLLSFLVLCLHWFNPLVWLAFSLSGKDMEMSCDEAVIRRLGNGIKKDYALSLLSLASDHRVLGGTPLAFGEGDASGRIRNVLNYKKPAVWVITVILAVCLAVGIACIANPRQSVYDPNDPVLRYADYGMKVSLGSRNASSQWNYITDWIGNNSPVNTEQNGEFTTSTYEGNEKLKKRLYPAPAAVSVVDRRTFHRSVELSYTTAAGEVVSLGFVEGALTSMIINDKTWKRLTVINYETGSAGVFLPVSEGANENKTLYPLPNEMQLPGNDFSLLPYGDPSPKRKLIDSFLEDYYTVADYSRLESYSNDGGEHTLPFSEYFTADGFLKFSASEQYLASDREVFESKLKWEYGGFETVSGSQTGSTGGYAYTVIVYYFVAGNSKAYQSDTWDINIILVEGQPKISYASMETLK